MGTNGCLAYQESLASRIWRRLGFRHAHVVRPETPDGAPEPWWLVTDTYFHFDWVDRLRVLASGKVMVEALTETDVMVSSARTTASIAVLPPTHRVRR